MEMRKISDKKYLKSEILNIMKCFKLGNFDKDVIKVNLSEMVDNLNLDKKVDDFANYLFLNSGYMVLLDGKRKLNFYFEKKNNSSIEFYSYISDYDFTIFNFVYNYNQPINVHSILIDKTRYYSYSSEGIDELRDLVVNLSIRMLWEINNYIVNRKIKIEEISRIRRISQNNSTTKKKRNKTIVVRTIEITSEIIRKINTNTSEEKRKYEHHIDSWGVRGHYRNYKSGKRKWIEPKEHKAHDRIGGENISTKKIYDITK